MSFSELGLDAALMRAIEREGYTTPTPIQAKAIPEVLAGRDVLAAAQTGTGKTAAFTLPLLQHLLTKPREGGKAPRILVLVPTRELAAQVGESVVAYGRDVTVKHAVIFGGVGINPQIDRVRRGLDIIIATPGRLLDLTGQGVLDLSKIEILVLDEADRMLDMGFMPDIKRVLKQLPAKRQNLMFSATFSPDIRGLAEGLLTNPVSIDIAPRNTATQLVDQRAIFAEKADKAGLLGFMVSRGNWKQVLVFTRTKHGANRLCERLEKDGLTAAALHGNKNQGAGRLQGRQRARAGRHRHCRPRHRHRKPAPRHQLRTAQRARRLCAPHRPHRSRRRRGRGHLAGRPRRARLPQADRTAHSPDHSGVRNRGLHPQRQARRAG